MVIIIITLKNAKNAAVKIDLIKLEKQKLNNLFKNELEWMKRMPQARGHKARFREDAFYELQEEKNNYNIDDRQLRLNTNDVYIGSKIFECQNVSKAFDKKVILNNFSYKFSRFEKMGIIGSNGIGKSTFLKLLLGIEEPDSGTFDIGSTVRFGYYSQEGLVFDENKKVIDIITDISENVNIGDGKTIPASQFLQQFLFTTEQQYNYVYKLSGGEKRKLYLCTVLLKIPNFLILDEPTNDLDIQTLQVLESYLQTFSGCVIVVSHDRFFMDKVVDHILVFNGNGVIKDFPGNYTQYREWIKLNSNKEHDKDANNIKSDKQNYHHETRKRMTYNQKLLFEKLSLDIDKLEKEQKEIEGSFISGILSVDKITELSKRLSEIKIELDKKSEDWLELSELENDKN
jgi:ATP-binding cassette subfamily F protein uup